MTDELKPCPHCDGPAERMWRYTLPGEGPVRYWVMCPACGASTKAFDTEEEADAAWNARAERTCRKVPGKMHYGQRRPKCSGCGYGLGDDRWGWCPKCGAKIEEVG